MKRYINIYISIVFIAIAYFLVTLYFALPYRFFPGDEVTFLEQVQDTYEINNISLNKFKKKKVPADVIEKLSSMKGTVYKYYDYRDTLSGMLGPDDFHKYKKIIFKYFTGVLVTVKVKEWRQRQGKVDGHGLHGRR